MHWDEFATSGKSLKGWEEAEETSEKTGKPRGDASMRGERGYLCRETQKGTLRKRRWRWCSRHEPGDGSDKQLPQVMGTRAGLDGARRTWEREAKPTLSRSH